jgi:hypothetical protein
MHCSICFVMISSGEGEGGALRTCVLCTTKSHKQIFEITEEEEEEEEHADDGSNMGKSSTSSPSSKLALEFIGEEEC